MAKIKVSMEAFYGYGCGGGSYSSDSEKEFEVSDEVLAALKKINEEEVTSDEVESAISEGQTNLEDLHDKIHEEVINMIEHYWIFDAGEDYDKDLSLKEFLESDIEDGTYEPELTFEQYDKLWKSCESDDDRLDLLGEFYEDDDMDDDSEYAMKERYYSYLFENYREWVYDRDDNMFIALRVGSELCFCDTDEWSYKIRFKD